MKLEEKVQILVVEDGDVFRKNISAALRTLGYINTTCVSNGQAALEFLLVNKVDVVISDLYMEPINGLQLLKMLRGGRFNSNIIFIMLTGESAKEKVVDVVKIGVDGYLVKPFTVNGLGIKIHEALKKRGVQ